MKRIACFTDSLGSGGAQRQLVGLATMLKERGYDVDVVLYYDIPFYKHLLDDAGVESFVVANTANPVKCIWALYRFFWQKNYDLVIAYQETPSLIACLLRPLLRWKKLIVSERNTTQIISRKDRVRFLLWRFADYIVPNSYSQAEFINANMPRISHKVQVITNFTDVEAFAPTTNKIVDKKRRKFSVIASIKPEKNFNRFIQAVKKVREHNDIYVCWYGIKEQFIEQYRDTLKQNFVDDIVEVFGYVKNPQEALNCSDFFCLPSLFEGFPNALCEAMSCGLPVACSNVCDNPQIVETAINGFLFNPYDIEDMANSLEQLLLISEEQYIKISENNRAKAVKMFSREAFVEKYLKLIES